MIERRGFLKGLLVTASAAAGTALIQLAEPREVQALTEHKPIELHTPIIADDSGEGFGPDFFGGELYIKCQSGRMAYLGHLTEISINARVHDLTTFDGQAIFIPSRHEAHVRFGGQFRR
jgi:hypothetical protein